MYRSYEDPKWLREEIKNQKAYIIQLKEAGCTDEEIYSQYETLMDLEDRLRFAEADLYEED